MYLISSKQIMDAKGFEGKRSLLRGKVMVKDDCIVDDDFLEEDMEEEESDEKKKGVNVMHGKRGISGGGGGGASLPSCQVEKCGVDLREAKRYHRRHKVCEIHAKAPAVLVAGLRQRFCQQCSRFHELAEFDEAKRSCRRRLAGHNERRRKSSGELHGEGSSRRGSFDGQFRENERGKHLIYNNTSAGNSSYKRSYTR